ncbi:hypothetical protein MMC18_002066 [Xylographa bjoerkii]|nr:hypothetical protein [Xylographa bjoerkii]
MRSFSIAAFALFVACTTAAPLVKRDIIWFTVTEEVVETVEVVTTIWVAPGDLPPATTTTSTSSTPAPIVFLPIQSPVAPASSSSTTSIAPVVPAPSPVQPPSTSTSTTTTSTPTTSTTMASTTTSTTPAYTLPVDTPPAAPVPEPVSTSTSTPVPAAASTPAPVPVPVATPSPSPVAAAPAAPVAGGVTAGETPSSGTAIGAPPAADGKSYEVATLPGASQADGCTPGTPCVGDMTYYNPSQGLGACGYGPDSYTYQDTDFVVAVSHEMMGSLSSGDVENPLCWRVLHITNPATGQSNTGMVVDKCAGCAGLEDIDLSPALYNTLGLSSVGRYHNVQWYWD